MQEQLRHITGKSELSKGLREEYSNPFVTDLYQSRTLLCRLFDMKRLRDFMRLRGEHGKNSQNCKLGLFDRISLQKTVIVESVEAVPSKESMLMASQLESQKTHSTIYSH